MKTKLWVHRFIVVAALLAVGVSSYAAASASTYNQRNAWDQYRWPWAYGDVFTFSQGQYNSGTGAFDTHTTARNLADAIDVYKTANSPVWAARDGTAHCEDWTQVGYAFGYVIRVVHGADSDFYAHSDVCSIAIGTYVSVAQGRHISYTGTTGTSQYNFGDHLHFMRATTTTSTYSAPLTLEGVSSFPDPTVRGYTATSDNLSAGYSTSLAWEPTIHDTYLGFSGWSIVGSTASIPGWSPGRSTASGGCPGSATPGWYDCNVTGTGGIPRYGRVQTFKGSGSGSGEHAIFKRSSPSAPATFMSRAFLGGFTDDWDTGRDGLYFLGYPTGNSYYWTGTLYRMDFENGYATFNTNGSNESKFYLSGVTLKFTAYYAD